MTIKKEDGVYTVTEKCKDGRIIECQAFSARRAIEKVLSVVFQGIAINK